MNSNVCRGLDRTISGWSGASRRETNTQIVFSVAGTNFCWLSPNIGMVQVWPCLGPKCVTRRLVRAGDEVRVIRQKTGQVNAVYKDPGHKLMVRWSYPGFMCSGTPLGEALALISQAYESAKGISRVSGAIGKEASVPSATTYGSALTLPSKEELINAYHQLYEKHPHDLLPLETELPEELQWKQRDEYRTIMTMILSEETGDCQLSKALGRLFREHPNMNRFKGLNKSQVTALLKSCDFQVEGFRQQRNVERFLGFKGLFFGKWYELMPPGNTAIADLWALARSGYGQKFIRAVEAYAFGVRSVLPLDTPGFRFLQQVYGWYKGWTVDRARQDIETKLAGAGIPLIDFHELLRFNGQTKKGKTNLNNVVVGWNTWRLLCSKERDRITKDWRWIQEHLVKN